ncbi:MAG: EAL domain-containing protein [Deltaproteobacteria bacterium]|nr:EAL domain-containing protein [Deltaproteobacteria bacterium]
MTKKKILIIGEKNKVSMNTFLKRLGIKTEFVNNDKEIELSLAKGVFSLIIISVDPSGNDGFKILSTIKKLSKTENSPVVFISEKKDREHVKKAYKKGVIEYFFKPFNPDILFYKLKNIINLYNYNEDILNKHQSEIKLAETIIKTSTQGVIVTDVSGNIESVNRSFTNITGYTENEVIGKNPRMLKSDKQKSNFYKKMWNSINENGVFNGEIWNKRKNGETYPEWLTISEVKDDYNEVKKYIGVFHEIKSQKNKVDNEHSNYDQLTSLPDITLLKDRFSQCIKRAERVPSMTAFLLVDVYNAEEFNKSGQYGDKLIQMLAKKIDEVFLADETVSRIDKNRFAVLIPDIESMYDLKDVSKKILYVNKPFIINNVQFVMNVNIGISLYPEDGKDFNTLLKIAESEMNKTKEIGKGNFRINKGINAKKWIALETDLTKALKRDEFLIHYQPQIDTKNNKITGVEALLRWNSKRYGIIKPDDFIPMAESSGLIYDIGLWVLKSAINQTAKWHNMGFKISIAINLSAKQLKRYELIAIINKILDENSFSAKYLNLEVTENSVMENFDMALKMMKAFDNSGIRISIDDFGTGYSSLKHLKHFPVKILKVDKSFVQDIPKNTNDIAVARTILSLSKNLGLKVVAEGVETKEQYDFMISNGCDYIQGFYFSKPLNAKHMTTYLKKYK